jgi:hypothetical protein
MPRKPVDVTVEILKDIRDAVRATNARLAQTNEGLDAVKTELGARLDQTNARLDAVEHTLVDMAGQLTFLGRYVRHSVRRHGARIDKLEGRVDKLEQRVGP